jgi:hypothetical protein
VEWSEWLVRGGSGSCGAGLAEYRCHARAEGKFDRMYELRDKKFGSGGGGVKAVIGFPVIIAD